MFRFALGANLGVPPAQTTLRLGEFTAIEDAFEVARTAAAQSTRELAKLAAPDEGDTETVPTEFGYDVKRGFRTLVRFWIYSRPGVA